MLDRLLDASPFVPPDVVGLAQWVAEYYAAGPGEAILARPRLALDVAWAGRLMERREMRALTNRAAQALEASGDWRVW